MFMFYKGKLLQPKQVKNVQYENLQMRLIKF